MALQGDGAGGVQETKAERHARGFTCWGQFVAMLFCQLGQARSPVGLILARPGEAG